MHLLSMQQFSSQSEGEPVDLEHSPADVIFFSAADTELSLLDQCFNEKNPPFTIKIANLMMLSHNLSVDIYCENTLAKAKIIVARVLGGVSYWPYGLEAIAKSARQNNAMLIVLPGDDSFDTNIMRYSNVDQKTQTQIAQFLFQGGKQNMFHFIEHLGALLKGKQFCKNAQKILKSGYYHYKNSSYNITEVQKHWNNDYPIAMIVFYRALLQSGMTKPIDALIHKLHKSKINPLPIFVSSLKDDFSISIINNAIETNNINIIINATAFASAKNHYDQELSILSNILAKADCPVLQAVVSQSDRNDWNKSTKGLNAKDLSMNVVLPEFDGRINADIISFKKRQQVNQNTGYASTSFIPNQKGINFNCELAANYCKMANTKENKRKIAIIMPNYPNRDGRLANGVGLDTPQSAIEILNHLKKNQYFLEKTFKNGNQLINQIRKIPTNANPKRKSILYFDLKKYQKFFCKLPRKLQQNITKRWGKPQNDPFFNKSKNAFRLALMPNGNIVIGIQPDRGYNLDIEATYHDPELMPPHCYLAFYAFLRYEYKIHAIIHLGKHGNLEWLPGKALALGDQCCPKAILGTLPHFYPFIVNNPGEGMQAKRRNHAVIIDHLTPPMARAQTYGYLQKIEAMVDEYYQAISFDDKRAKILEDNIIKTVKEAKIDEDFQIDDNDDIKQNLLKIDYQICEIKELQIRNGLHIFGKKQPPESQAEFIVALLRNDRGDKQKHNRSLTKSIVLDAGISDFNPLKYKPDQKITKIPPFIQKSAGKIIRNHAQLLDTIENIALKFIKDKTKIPQNWENTKQVIEFNLDKIQNLISKSVQNELLSITKALNGKFIPPGSAGAPTRGRIDVLPTGKNFFSIDTRTIPTQTACIIGKKSAELVVERYLQENGEYPKNIGISVWATSNMRTGGDDIAQALALVGVEPVRDNERVVGFEIIPPSILARPRVDVTLRISGLFRDAFPQIIEFFDKVVQEIAKLDEKPEINPIAENIRLETQKIAAKTNDQKYAHRCASLRVFSAKPGAYGAGIQQLIDNHAWKNQDELAENWLKWSAYAYGENYYGEHNYTQFKNRIKNLQIVMQNQDNQEHDIFDSDDYYQFQGAMVLAHRHLKGKNPTIYHNDLSKPENPVVRTLQEEITRILHGRVFNPKWQNAIMKHGYKGGAEIAATIDYIFAYAITTENVTSTHFELIYQNYIENEKIFNFLKKNNPQALKEIAITMLEAHKRNYWNTKSNSAINTLEKL